MTEAELKAALLFVRERLDLALPNGRYSQIFALELAAHLASRSANIFQILDELRILDGTYSRYPSRTKPATEFRGAWLRGLWQKHYMQARFIPTNLFKHWEREGLEKILAPMKRGRDHFELSDVREITHRLVSESYITRSNSNQLTGEWIVYGINSGDNIYLTLADHSEADEDIWIRCKASAAEFPGFALLQEERAG